MLLFGSKSQPARAVWIEICEILHVQAHEPSQPARAVWIEMRKGIKILLQKLVTACEGCVD